MPIVYAGDELQHTPVKPCVRSYGDKPVAGSGEDGWGGGSIACGSTNLLPGSHR
jgi:hypothetical protein